MVHGQLFIKHCPNTLQTNSISADRDSLDLEREMQWQKQGQEILHKKMQLVQAGEAQEGKMKILAGNRECQIRSEKENHFQRNYNSE